MRVLERGRTRKYRERDREKPWRSEMRQRSRCLEELHEVGEVNFLYTVIVAMNSVVVLLF